MADFFQTGAIATLHRLGRRDVNRLEGELEEIARYSPIALVLPCHVNELRSPALRHIIHELKQVKYLKQIVVGIDGASAADWRKAKKVFGELPQKPTLLWNDGPRMQRLYEKLKAADLHIGSPGKGRNLWICFGYVIASGQAKVIAAHDTDITTYTRELLARLVYPVAHTSMGFDFCKGYYPRFTDRLNGRVMRLMLTPLIRSLLGIVGPQPYLVYLDTFRYPLAGEVALTVDIARRMRLPYDWGVEIGVLAEVFRNTAPRAICQSELCENYDHKHQDISSRDSSKGLNKMAVDVAKSIFRTMAAEGIRLDTGLFDTLLSAYVRRAEDTVRHYGADAAINGLKFDRHEEEVAVHTFARSIRTAARAFLEDPLGTPPIPNWNRVRSALPRFFDDLRDAVHKDNRAK
ncbi:MAG: glycosyl transferase [Verrucomicrobia bacterium]|nr:glycosyl transferase [Verrucomicrobiota bacterium]